MACTGKGGVCGSGPAARTKGADTTGQGTGCRSGHDAAAQGGAQKAVGMNACGEARNESQPGSLEEEGRPWHFIRIRRQDNRLMERRISWRAKWEAYINCVSRLVRTISAAPAHFPPNSFPMRQSRKRHIRPAVRERRRRDCILYPKMRIYPI